MTNEVMTRYFHLTFFFLWHVEVHLLLQWFLVVHHDRKISAEIEPA